MTCPTCGHPLKAGDAFCTSCGAPAAPPVKAVTATTPGEPAAAAFAGAEPVEAANRHAVSGTLIDNKYKIDRVLGEGGMGVVYLAEDVHTGAHVVLKAIRPELAHRKDIRDRTLAEGRALARIDHPNVVHLNAVVEDATGLWLVMQHIDGESLDRTIKRYAQQGQRVSFTIAIDIFKQILQGVAAAHREGVIHRDLKPANVLVRRKDGVAKVTDFGIAKPEEQARAGQGKTKGVIGSLWYMSPEQVQGRKDLDKRVDIYSLGILLFELLTGRVPFNADSSYELMRKHVEEPLPKVAAERADAPAWVDEILARACAKNRDERFGSAEEFLSAIEAHAPARGTQVAAPLTRFGGDAAPGADPAPTAAGTSLTSVGESGGGSRAVVWIGAVIALLGLGAVGVWQSGILDPDPAAKKQKQKKGGPEQGTAVGTNEPPPAASSAAPDTPPADPLDPLPGKWRSEAGTDFEAVRVGDAVEFRVVDPAQLAPSDYRAGEARFVLRAADGGFTVEDKIRPQPPRGKEFDPRSRNTCQEVWTEVDGKALRASFDGERLTVSFAKIAPRASNFTIEDDKVVGCVGLRDVAASRIQSVLKKN